MPEAMALRRLLIENLQGVVLARNAIPGMEKHCLFLNEYVQGKSVTAIAELLGITRSYTSRKYRKEALDLVVAHFIEKYL